MGEGGSKQNISVITIVVVAVLFLTLMGLTAALIMTFLSTSEEVDAFDLNQVTANQDSSEGDVTDWFLPEFAGITTEGVSLGVSASVGITEEIFRLCAPVIGEVMTEDCLEGEISAEEWTALSKESDFVYFRLHQQLPRSVLSLFCGMYTDGADSERIEGNVYEILVLPLKESIRHKTSVVRMAVRELDGSASLYVKAVPAAVLTAEDLDKTVSSYRSNLTAFAFSGEHPVLSSPTEPVFLKPVSFRNIMITGDTATLIEDDGDETEMLLRAFGLNPDKLLSTHVDEAGNRSYIDTHGILNLEASMLEYSSTADGGLRVSDLVTVRFDTWAHTLESYLLAASELWNRIKDINPLITGDEADLVLNTLSVSQGMVHMTFLYTVDNLRIATDVPAFDVVMENGILRSANIHTIAVLALSTRSESLSEHWFLDTVAGDSLRNVTLVYRNRYAPVDSADYTSDGLGAEWAGMSDVKKEDG